jgi:malate dehydrogenase
LHIAQVGTGRVGRPTAYAIMSAHLADTITVCDTKPGLAKAFAEELKHVTASLQIDVEIIAHEKDEDIEDADIILISAGIPRTPGIIMSRRDLAVQNAKIVKNISELTSNNNPRVKYIVISNPVDVMAMVCKKYSGAKFVISSGTNLETLRFRSKLAESLKLPVSSVKGWVGGEHGKDAIILWSTVKVNDMPIKEYLKENEITLSKTEISTYMKEVSKTIVDNIGGTEFGPAASFRDITRAIINNTNEIIPIAAPQKFEDLPEPIFVSVPRKLGKTIGDSIFDVLLTSEKIGILKAAEAIYQNFKTVS